MQRIMITHTVEDMERWLRGKQERATGLGEVGSNVRDFVAADGSMNVAVSADVDDMDALQAMLSAPSAELAGLMEKHGVRPPFTLYVEK
jgi:hypothetical protein